MSDLSAHRPTVGATAMAAFFRICTAVAVIFGLTMTGIVNFQILVRYVPFVSTPWTEEAARYLWIWAIAMMAGPCYIYGDYVGIDIASKIISKSIWGSLRRICHLIAAGLGGVIAVYGSTLALSTTNQISSALQVNMGLVNASMGFLGANIALAALYVLGGGTKAVLLGKDTALAGMEN